ncbi:hypothetical protein ACVIKO_004123 [Rhizobium ruizarguesonis]
MWKGRRFAGLFCFAGDGSLSLCGKERAAADGLSFALKAFVANAPHPPHLPYGHLLPAGEKGEQDVDHLRYSKGVKGNEAVPRLRFSPAGRRCRQADEGVSCEAANALSASEGHGPLLMSNVTHRLPALRFGLRAFVAAIDSLDRLLGLRPTAPHPFPIRIPAPSTRPPPSTTWKAARRKGVSM